MSLKKQIYGCAEGSHNISYEAQPYFSFCENKMYITSHL